jgi:hypothetical protein
MGVSCCLWVHKIDELFCEEFCGLYWILSLILFDYLCYLLCQAACLFIFFFVHTKKKTNQKKKSAVCHSKATPSHLWAKTNKRPRCAHLNVFVS